MKKIIYWILGGVAVIVIILAIIVKLGFAGGSVALVPTIQVTEKGTDSLRVSYPIANDEIINPLIVKGEARGTWYFEAVFPVVLTDWDGKIIAQGQAQAHPPAGGDWMTTDFVPFTATLNFTKLSYGKNGFLILKKDNPSGLPLNDDSLEIPVNFK